MSLPQLSVVHHDHESPADRARRLYAEAQSAALEQVNDLENAISAVEELAASVAEGGDIYPAGVRDLSRRLVEELTLRRQTLEALAARVVVAS